MIWTTDSMPPTTTHPPPNAPPTGGGDRFGDDADWTAFSGAFAGRVAAMDATTVAAAAKRAVDEVRRLDRRSAWYNAAEISAGVAVAAAFLWISITRVPPPAKFAAWWIAGVAVFTLARGIVRRVPVGSDGVTRGWLTSRRDAIDRDIHVARTMTRWCLAPLAVGYLAFVWSMLPAGWAVLASGACYVVDRIIRYLAHRRVDRELIPVREEIDRVLAQYDEPDADSL